MSLNLETWKTRRKELGWTYEALAEKAQVSLNTIKNIFRGQTTDPRLETVQAIEKALGLALSFTKADKAKGISSAVELTEKENYRLTLLGDADRILGEKYVDMYLSLLAETMNKNKQNN